MRAKPAARAGPAVAVAAVAGLAPFEFNDLVVGVGVVDLRLVQIMTLGLAGLALLFAQKGSLGRVGRFPWLFGGAYSVGVCASWFAADPFPVNMTTTAVRLLLGPVLAVSVLVLMQSSNGDGRRNVLRVLEWLVWGAAGASVIGLLAWMLGGDVGPTSWFRGSPTELGPYQRLTRPFNHANVAAMFLAPVALVAMALAASERRASRWLLASTIAAAAVATYSRMVPIVLVLGCLCAAWSWRSIDGGARRWLRPGVAVVVLIGLFVTISPAWTARLGAPGRQAWFGADIEAQLIDPEPGEVAVEVVVTNQSTQTWTAAGEQRVELSLRWRSVDGETQFAEQQVSLAQDLAPGASQRFAFRAKTPAILAPGSYVVLVDVVRDREAYFQEVLGGATELVYEGGAADPGRSGSAVLRPIPELRRTDLWRAALSLSGENPIVGVGPGNYRLLYGEALDLEEFSKGSHAHSLIFEPLASTGPVVTVSIIGMIGGVFITAIRRRQRGQLRVEHGAVLIAVLAMALQGLVDWPLIFSATGFVFWLLLALWVQLGRLEVEL
ncbi:MAG: hypothetical protein ACI8Y4_003352 [Candidatus Poriferisodalaceae bacterium]|jgi:hypothetical protein